MSSPLHTEQFPTGAAGGTPAESHEVGATLRGTVFAEKKGMVGSEWTSSDPEKRRKILVAEGFTPNPGQSYTVVIVRDTNPSDPTKGKLFVKRLMVDTAGKNKALSREEWEIAEDELDLRERDIRKGIGAHAEAYARTGEFKADRDALLEEGQSRVAIEALRRERAADETEDETLAEDTPLSSL
ncbi:MAG: hypothetical protein WBK28_00675, partial [Minisyncoccia bacterium]